MLEVGSFLGTSASFLLRVMAPWNGTLTSVDPNVRHRVFEHPRDFFHRMTNKFSGRVHAIDAFWVDALDVESGTWDYQNRKPVYDLQQIEAIVSKVAVLDPQQAIQAGVKFDATFIDGAHSKASVIKDFLQMKDVMQPGSCVMFDDNDWSPVNEALNEIQQMVGEFTQSTHIGWRGQV